MDDDMLVLPGGVFAMGSAQFYGDEGPVRRVRVDGFAIDRAPVTNAQFAAFVTASGYVTAAEHAPDAAMYPGADPALLVAGSAVFMPTPVPVPLHDPFVWWAFIAGADWRHPWGPESDAAALPNHPVVHIGYDDALAYAAWADKRLPTEAEWEYAARGGVADRAYAWGDTLAPDGAVLANYWHGGTFPVARAGGAQHPFTTPIGQYPPNDFGLYDMIGNVWEWTADWYAERHIVTQDKGEGDKGGQNKDGQSKGEQGASCCIPANPRGAREADSKMTHDPLEAPRKVLKGGSHLCAESYCQRYRPAARHPQPIDTTTSHVGFRCVRDL